jgi:DNA repair protein RecO (recombination protein O)
MLHTRGIVFRTVKYGETSIIADIYTEEKGLQSFIGGNVRSAKSAMSYSLFQPMQVLDIVSYFKDSGKALNRLKEVQLSIHFERIPYDVRRGAVSLFIAEVLRKSIGEELEDRAFFQFLVETVTLLDQGPDEVIPLIPAWLLAQLTDWLGIRPAISDAFDDHDIILLDLRDGATTNLPNPLSEQLEADTTRLFFLLLETPSFELEQVVISANERRALLSGLLKYYQYHIDKFQQINAHEVLNTVFHG